LPIDIFFRSLAADRQENSIGIILSGMGSDGSLGLKAIKEKNGVVLVQDPATAKFDSMPRNATEAVIADIVAPVEELPAKLIDFLKFTPTIKTEPDIDSKGNLDKIFILLREQTGHDFSLYKKNTLLRRIDRRKGVHQISRIQSYVRLLQENPQEVQILFKELLIGVTSFFRDAAVLQENVLPVLMNELPNGTILRAWVTGCSTGEEAYSLAIVFKEALEKTEIRKNLSLQIFATDLDSDTIEIARRGVFSSNIVADVSPERISRFFIAEAENYRVNAAIREMVVFAPQNVIKDPPFTKLDILMCRNVLIYMESELQNKLVKLFNYSLNPGGILILGTAETPGNQKEGFEELDGRLKIFKRSKPLPSELIDFPSSFGRNKAVATVTTKLPDVVENIQILADQFLLQRFAPASVLVNAQGDILYITGRIGKYLELVAGKANLNIFAMAHEDLRQELPGAFRKAGGSFDAVILRNINIRTISGGTQFVDVTVQSIEKTDSIKGMIMVVFTDVPAVVEHDVVNTKTGKRRATGRQKELENQLQRSREDRQSIYEEMQTSQEELKSTNEELQSTNEELQSTNEELTTSKEEMQSLNEELQTVNIELQSKVNDFVQANNDMKNLLNSTEIATLFLDKELNIRRFTDNTINIFKLRSMDIGRPFTDIVTDLQYPELDSHARQVLKTLISIETAITTNDQRWFNVRIMPYRTLDDHIDGLVITFSDITEAKKIEMDLKRLNEALTISETRYRRLFESAKDGILILDAETGKIMDVNPFLVGMLGYSKEQFIEKTIWEIGFFKDIVANQDKFSELQQREFVRYENLPLETADGRKINVEFISNVYLVADNKVIQCIVRDISERKQLEDVLLQSKKSP
jgi:two-component system CheB/CheR fusion protein